jgi:hypothetical protein
VFSDDAWVIEILTVSSLLNFTSAPRPTSARLPRERSTMRRIQWSAAVARICRSEFLFLAVGSVLVVWIAHLF